MRTKMSKTLFWVGIVMTLTACGQKADSTENLAKDINMDTENLNSAQKSGGNDASAEASDQQTPDVEGETFNFVYEGVSLIPGELADLSALPKYADVDEVPSCAFGGNDNVYNFEMFELTTYFDQDEERVYSIYFLDPNLPTTEGLCLGDSVDDMKALYGETYEVEENAYIYTRGETLLTIVTKNNIIISIEYCLNR